MSRDPVTTLQQLIAIPSINPLGHDGSTDLCGEARLTDFLQGLCEESGWRWLRQPVHAGRDNLLALVPGTPPAGDGGELQLWDVHQDTVAVDGMSVAPFGGTLRDGRIYGRGACDDKGPMAAMLAALSRIDVRQRIERRPTVVIAFTANEECGFTGASALTRLWKSRDAGDAARTTAGTVTPAELFPRPPDAAIVAEPTDLHVVVAHQGVVRWRCHAIGRAAHSSRPEEGVNAIYAMSRVVQAIEAYAQQLAAGPTHPLCDRPAVSATTITGGVGINTVPDRATITIDRRVGPGENPDAAYEDLIRYIAEHSDLGDARLEHEPPFMTSSGLADTHNGRLAQRVAELVRRCDRSCRQVGAPYGTDAAAIGVAGVPTVVFGPGSVRQAHTVDEFIEVRELELGADLYYRIATEGLRDDRP